jgi:hypothetical protein
MWPPLSRHQNPPPASAEHALEEPTIGGPDRAGLPGWESFPAVERRHLLEVLVQTARHQVPTRPTDPLSQGRR